MDGNTDNVITIDNFTTKLSPLNPQARPLFALVDMGSNGIRFSISDLSEPRSRLLPCIYRERAGISLYDALHESSDASQAFHFSKDIISKVAETLTHFRHICDVYQVPQEQITVFATEAMRTAHNKDEILNAIKQASGLTVSLLAPAMESLFGAMGARSAYDHVDGLFMDLGGGSVQMTYVNSRDESYDVLAARAAQSMPYGAAKLTAALSVQSEADTAQSDLQTQMKRTFNSMLSQFPQLRAQAESSEGISIYFCGGGFRGYGSMLMHTHKVQPYPIPVIGGFTVSGDEFIQVKDMLKANQHDGKIYGMSKRRRAQFPAIAMVVEALINAVPKIKQVTFCSGGNREGVLYMKISPAIRESNPLPLLPGGADSTPADSINAVVELISTSLLNTSPLTFSSELLHYIVRNIWIAMGDPDDANSAKALHNPISGHIAGLPGLTHETRAILSLTLCARWGTTLGPIDRKVYENLLQFLGPELSFWCQYIGALARLLAIIFPLCPSRAQLQEIISLNASSSHHLGKKGKKTGIKLLVTLAPLGKIGIDLEGAVGVFKDVGKDLNLDWHVEAELV